MEKWSNTFYSSSNGQNFTRFYAALRTGWSLGLIKILFIFYAGLHVVYFECSVGAKICGDVWSVEASGNIEKCVTEPPELPILCTRYCGFPRRCRGCDNSNWKGNNTQTEKLMVAVLVMSTGYGLDGPGIESQWGEVFRTCPGRSWGPPSLLYKGYRVFPGSKERPGCDADPSPPSRSVVKKE